MPTAIPIDPTNSRSYFWMLFLVDVQNSKYKNTQQATVRKGSFSPNSSSQGLSVQFWSQFWPKMTVKSSDKTVTKPTTGETFV